MFHSKVHDPQYLKKQYEDSSNVDARIRLHQRFSVNKYGWQRWVFDQFELPDKCRILELGCGPGQLWLDNLERIPAGWEISLSDSSAGMLEGTRRNLETQRPFQFKVMDAQSIPLESKCFDAVIANHMLQHVPDRPKAFSEICRVLKPAGVFYASTVGERHLSEIRDLLYKFDASLVSWGRVSEYFTLENGMAQLAEWFTGTKLYRYEDALEVSEVAALVDYILSGWAQQILGKRREQFSDFVAHEMEARGGVFHVTKDSGLFVSS
jgi:ubiquinone/menaquinone biosynthesis C-methylase UbiE